MKNEIKKIKSSTLFDEEFYISYYDDVKDLDINPIEHYIKIGAYLGRNPSLNFDTSLYKEYHQDVDFSKINPLIHYIEKGYKEGRKCNHYSYYYKTNNKRKALFDKSIITYKKNKKRNNKIVVYTAIIGDYDVLKIPENLDPEIDYVCFTDMFYVGLHPWIMKKPRFYHKNPIITSRYHKTHPFELFENSEYEVAIWIDSSLMIRSSCNLQQLVLRHVKSKGVLSSALHPYRNSIDEEVNAILAQKKAENSLLIKQYELYKKDIKLNVLYETGVLISQINDQKARIFFKLWWEQLNLYSSRDQISIIYVIEKTGYYVNNLFEIGYDFRFDKDYFAYFPHNNDIGGLYSNYQWPMNYLEKNLSRPIDNPKIKIGVVCGETSSGYKGTTFIRLILPILYLVDYDNRFDVVFITNSMIEYGCIDFADYIDVLFCLRNELSEYNLILLKSLCEKRNVPVVYDIDDNLLIDAPNFKVSQKDINNILYYLEWANIITCSMKNLQLLIQKYTSKPVLIRENALDKKLWFEVNNNKNNLKLRDKVKILYMGTKSHDDDLLMIEEAAVKILNKYSNVSFYIIGGINSKKPWLQNIALESVDYPEFVSLFKEISQDFDFAIAPLCSSDFNKCKSNIKFFDYSAVGLPGLYSDNDIYRQVIDDYKTGILVKNTTNSWYSALEYMIKNPFERSRIAKNAFEVVYKYHCIDKNYIKTIKNQIYSLTSKKVDLKKITYKTYRDIRQAIKNNINKVSTKFDLIVGIPRSGMIPAYILGFQLNLQVISFDEFRNNILQTKGDRKIKNILPDSLNILFVDDSINTGRSYKRIKSLLPLTYCSKPYKFDFLAVYATSLAAKNNDVLYFEICEQPRLFEWNYKNHSIATLSCYDLDGVLCIDPTDEENDDGKKYINFILNAQPLFIPQYKIKAIVTSRLEKYRKETEKWLSEHRVLYDKLYMLDLPSKEERIKRKCHASFKAEIYKSLDDTILFYESNKNQAIEISKITRKQVICIENDILY